MKKPTAVTENGKLLTALGEIRISEKQIGWIYDANAQSIGIWLSGTNDHDIKVEIK